MPQLPRAGTALFVALFCVTLPGCGTAPTGSGGGASGTTSGEVTSADSTSSSVTSNGASDASSASSTGTSITPACVSLKDGVAPNPTPGSCDGNVAITCAEDGTLSQEACGQGATCTTYELKEWKWNGMNNVNKFEPGRTVTWAGCKPTGTQACVMTFDGGNYNATVPNQCNGVDEVICHLPPAPNLSASSPQLIYGTLDGWLTSTACPIHQHCAGSDTLNELTCIDDSTPACDGTEPFCSTQGIVECQGTWESQPGYRVTEACPTGNVCQPTTLGPDCIGSEEVPCTTATFGPQRCETDHGSIVTCWAGFTNHQSCATCMDANNQPVPCRCDTVYDPQIEDFDETNGLTCTNFASVSCVPQTDAHCDPSIDADTCIGNVAHRCLGEWNDVDCGAHGMICDIVSGQSGCREANAPTCDLGGYFDACDGTTMIGCCACGVGAQLFGPPIPPCVPGYAVRNDCSVLGPQMTCKDTGPPFHQVDCENSP